jgi:hypothetical protein
LKVPINPDGGSNYVAANTCAPLVQDGGYGTDPAICTGIGPRMVLSVQSNASGSLQLGTSSTVASPSQSRHICAQSATGAGNALTGLSDCLVTQAVGSGETCVSFLPDTFDGGTQTLRIFKVTSAPTFSGQ